MAAPLVVPTFRGFVATTVDAALLVEAAIAGRLPHVADRPDNAGYRQLARSGTIVVFGPGIQRWREGLSWSARRALGNGFDVYRETSETHKLSERDQVSTFLSPSHQIPPIPCPDCPETSLRRPLFLPAPRVSGSLHP